MKKQLFVLITALALVSQLHAYTFGRGAVRPNAQMIKEYTTVRNFYVQAQDKGSSAFKSKSAGLIEHALLEIAGAQGRLHEFASKWTMYPQFEKGLGKPTIDTMHKNLSQVDKDLKKRLRLGDVE